MVTPSHDEIRAEALRVYMEESYRAGLEDISTPEDHELKEGNFWERAKIDLMTGPEAKAADELVAYLEYSASELEEVVVKSENLKDLLEASRKLEGIEDKIKDLRRKRRKEKEEAKLRIAELERKLEEARVPPPPKVIKAPPKPPEEPLCPAHKVELINVAATQPDTGWEFPWGRIYVPSEMFLFQCPQEFEYYVCEPRKRCELVRLDLLRRMLPAVPPIPKHKYLTDEQVKGLWQEFVAYGVSLKDMKEPRHYRVRFMAEIATAKDYETAAKRGRRLIETILKEIRPPPVPRRVRAPILEPVEREPDFETYLKRCGIDMEDYRLLGHIGQTVMRQEFRRWKKDPW